MGWTNWSAFALASLVMALIPGPGVVSVIGYAISSGRRAALASVAGMALGNAIAMTLSLAGVGVLLATSATAFAIVKWAGAAYLIGLGAFVIWHSGSAGPASSPSPISARAAFAGNVMVGTFHPKTIIFFVAFAPQFLNPAGDYTSQAALLVVTFCAVAACTDSGYAIAASRAAIVLRGPRALRWAKRTGGGFLVASGMATAALRR